MKITTTLLSDEARPADVRHLAAPGITLGRCSDNDIPLCGGQKPVGRVQAVIRSDGEYWLLESLSKISAVWLNGRPLAPRQTAALASGDRIRIGDHEVCVEEERWAERAEAEKSDESPSPAEETDIFQDLLGGPGVLPVGGNMPVETVHPFDMQSSTLRNHPDPLALLPEEREPLPPVTQACVTPDASFDHILSDPTPTTLDLREPLAAHRGHDIRETLATGREIEPS